MGALPSEGHYANVATIYHGNVYYGRSALREWQHGVILAALDLHAGHRVADVGGGNGEFVKECLEAAPHAETMALCVVEPSAAMREAPATQAKAAEPAVTILGLDAAAWAADAAEGQRHHRVILKEVVHHLDDRTAFFRDVRENRLEQGGYVLVVTRPQHDIDYPFWPAASAVWAAAQPSTDDVVAELKAAGFDDVSETVEVFGVGLALNVWLEMIKQRFWSTFSNFNDDELEQGCDYVRRTHASQGVLRRFEERYVLVRARVLSE
ncbi:S-adenosyl-L-methionine-dependent methyltransferase [Pelagophyceae sp. CCMP2097]|nr:S-adenosyl-L-methionine-dependent methyltransferase [Pelagophyceae sp. CCMP2097]|mmetsp:Transcript_23066/g.77933  ORF Transcript_23066/g.77933 Transcript_23066/m.77933 type:complete len:266 (-) Transcript_23066:2663-3460(-)